MARDDALDPRSEETRRRDTPPYEPPAFEVISLGCEVSAYAPDDDPLF